MKEDLSWEAEWIRHNKDTFKVKAKAEVVVDIADMEAEEEADPDIQFRA